MSPRGGTARAIGTRHMSHAYDKVLVAVEGSITFRATALGTAVELREGDRLDLPAGTDPRCRGGSRPASAVWRPTCPRARCTRKPRPMADWVAGLTTTRTANRRRR